MAVLPIQAGIQNSHHDFSSYAWSSFERCKVCHTPHNADTTAPNSPLWNHSVTSASYTPYSATQLNSTPDVPSGVSLLCLSCHDGTIAVDAFGGSSGTWNVSFGDLGLDMRRNHPISFVYDNDLASADGELHDPTTEL